MNFLSSLNWRQLFVVQLGKDQGGKPWQLHVFQQVDNNFEIALDIWNLENIIDGLEECDSIKDYILEMKKT